jgi:futalosine hydrolase
VTPRAASPSLLAVTAVEAERRAVLRHLQGSSQQHLGCTTGQTAVTAAGALTVICAGVGPAAAAAATSAALANGEWDAVLTLGVGGGFEPVAPVGSVVVASAIVASDLGAGSPDGFIPLNQLGLGPVRFEVPEWWASTAQRRITQRCLSLQVVRGDVLTVSTVTGTHRRASRLLARHPDAAAEAMEGAGVATAAAMFGVPVMEMRAVSNLVGDRNRPSWRMTVALDVLAETAAAVLDGPLPGLAAAPRPQPRQQATAPPDADARAGPR